MVADFDPDSEIRVVDKCQVICLALRVLKLKLELSDIGFAIEFQLRHGIVGEEL